MAQQLMVLKKSEPAPYTGVLMPREMLERLELNSEMEAFYKDKAIDIPDSTPDLGAFSSVNPTAFVITGVVGIAIGFVLGTIAHH